MSTPPDKPPTQESVEAAQRFAASLPALPQARTLENLKQAFDERLAAMSDDDILREFAKSTFSETKPTDYERGFKDGHEAGRQAMEILETVSFHLRRNDHVMPPTGAACTNQIIDRIERFQAALRKAAEHL